MSQTFYLSLPFQQHSNLSKMQSFSYSEHSLLLRYSWTCNDFCGWGGGQKHDDKKFLNETSKRQTSNIQNLLHPHKVAEGAWICEKEHLKCLSLSVTLSFRVGFPLVATILHYQEWLGKKKKRKKNGHCPTVTWITTAYNKIKTKSTLKSNE